MDVWGPTKTASLGGHQYFVSIVDDYSRRCWVYLMRQRVEALELLVKWKNLMENKTGRKIKVLRYDYVEKYEDSFLQYVQNNGTVTHFTNGKDGATKELPCLAGEDSVFVV